MKVVGKEAAEDERLSEAIPAVLPSLRSAPANGRPLVLRPLAGTQQAP